MSILKPKYIVGADGSGDFSGIWLGPFRGVNNFGFQCVWTGTLTGTFSVQVSEDGPGTVAGGGDVAGTNPPTQPSGVLGATTLVDTGSIHGAQPAGSAGSLYFNFQNLAAPWIRVHYAHVSGAGNASVGASGGDR
jgi:hypothetical protein